MPGVHCSCTSYFICYSCLFYLLFCFLKLKIYILIHIRKKNISLDRFPETRLLFFGLIMGFLYLPCYLFHSCQTYLEHWLFKCSGTYISVACLAFTRVKMHFNMFQDIGTLLKKFREQTSFLAFKCICLFLPDETTQWFSWKYWEILKQYIRRTNGNTIIAQNYSSGIDFRIGDAAKIYIYKNVFLDLHILLACFNPLNTL